MATNSTLDPKYLINPNGSGADADNLNPDEKMKNLTREIGDRLRQDRFGGKSNFVEVIGQLREELLNNRGASSAYDLQTINEFDTNQEIWAPLLFNPKYNPSAKEYTKSIIQQLGGLDHLMQENGAVLQADLVKLLAGKQWALPASAVRFLQDEVLKEVQKERIKNERERNEEMAGNLSASGASAAQVRGRVVVLLLSWHVRASHEDVSGGSRRSCLVNLCDCKRIDDSGRKSGERRRGAVLPVHL